MAEILVAFDVPVQDAQGAFYARAVGRRAEDGMWEGWLEFVPAEPDEEPLVTPVESRQPARDHLVYWATGLTPVYLEGALNRARHATGVNVRAADSPLSDAPSPRPAAATRVVGTAPEAVLDPFDIGSRNPDLLRQELTALKRPRLLNIIDAYDLNPAREDLSWMTDAQLAHFIVVAVEAQLARRVERGSRSC